MTEPMTDKRLEELAKGTGFGSLEVAECVAEIRHLREDAEHAFNIFKNLWMGAKEENDFLLAEIHKQKRRMWGG